MQDHDDARDADDVRDEDDADDAAEDGASVDERSRASRLWLFAACLCLFAAAALWLLGHADAAFVVAALGVISWFLDVRVQLRRKSGHGDTETQGEEEKEEGVD